jgi:ABC-type multidrug transport system permease subunit
MSTELLAPPVLRREPLSGPWQLVKVLSRHALVSFVRTPTATFFTLVFPLSFLIIVGASVGRRIAHDDVHISQYLVAPFAVFGVAEAAFCVLAVGTATLRESGVLKRLQAAPVPAWTVVASRVVAAVAMSLLSVAVLVAVGVAGFEVELVWRKLPAALVTLVVGIVCCAALGLAVAALTRSVLAAQAFTNGVLIPLAFISHVFIVGTDPPAGLDWLSRALPLRHFADAMQGTFDPMTSGTGFAWADLAVMTAWAAAGATVAARRFGWEPRGSARRPTARGPAADRGSVPATGPALNGMSAARRVGRPSWWTLLVGQVGSAITGMRREKLPVFFAVIFPALLLLLFPAVIPQQQVHGMPYADFLLPALTAYAIAVAGYVNLSEAVARARAAGVLRRLRSTPLPRWAYIAGRLLGTLLVAATATAVLLAVGMMANGSRVDAWRLPALAVNVVLVGVCFGALGLALLALLPAARTVNAIALGTLLPLSFLSDVFYMGGELPGWLQGVGTALPLKHSVYALAAAMTQDGAGAGFSWPHLAVVAAWTVAALAVAGPLASVRRTLM